MISDEFFNFSITFNLCYVDKFAILMYKTFIYNFMFEGFCPFKFNENKSGTFALFVLIWFHLIIGIKSVVY